jgi:peptidoglycan/LPS O-acetylase OafA/YrhL
MTSQPTNSNKPGEVVSLTTIRGILAVWVVLYHFWNDVVLLFPGADFLSPVIHRGSLAVPAFFMLSGYVLAYNYFTQFFRLDRRQILRFYALRLARIYPVHFVTLIAVLAMFLIGRRFGVELSSRGYLLSDFLLNVFLMHTWVPNFELNWNYPSWSISSEWFAYLIFPWLIFALSKIEWTRWKASMFLIGALSASVGVIQAGRMIPMQELVLVIPNFIFGIAVFVGLRTIDLGQRSSFLVRCLPETMLLSVVAACYLPHARAAVAVASLGLGSLVFILAALGSRCHAHWNWNSGRLLGEASYSLYMTHTIVQKIVYTLLPASRFSDSTWFVKSVVLLAYSASIIACCALTYIVIEYPARRIGKNLALRMTG